MSLFLAFPINNFDKQQLKIPINQFSKHLVSGDLEDSAALHITLLHVLDDDIYPTIKMMKLWEQYYKSQRQSFIVKANKFNHFNDIYWLGLDNALPLYQINAEFRKLADYLNISYDKSHGDYTPHITISFNSVVGDANQMSKLSFNPIPITIDSIVLWGYDEKIKNVHISSILYQINLRK